MALCDGHERQPPPRHCPLSSWVAYFWLLAFGHRVQGRGSLAMLFELADIRVSHLECGLRVTGHGRGETRQGLYVPSLSWPYLMPQEALGSGVNVHVNERRGADD
eukprot:scaffold223636_cov30-Tisochrysis_lutea.AAC.1